MPISGGRGLNANAWIQIQSLAFYVGQYNIQPNIMILCWGDISSVLEKKKHATMLALQISHQC